VTAATPDPPAGLTVPSGRASLHVERRGPEGAFPLICLHSGVTDRRSWHGLMDELTASDVVAYDMVAYDRRGVGSTTYQEEAHDQVTDLVAVLDQLALSEVVLIGNSRGGAIALDAALEHPDRIAALVLLAPAITGAPAIDEASVDAEEAKVWATLEAAEAAGDLDALNEGEVRFWLDGPKAPAGRVGGELRQLALQMNSVALHAESPGHEPAVRDAWSRLSEVRCPVLLMVGQFDLGAIGVRCRQAAEVIPGAELVELGGVAHLIAFEEPAAVAAAVRDFVARRVGGAAPASGGAEAPR
jgi:pimeloyl-ACP methyl ester carboxylesterase